VKYSRYKVYSGLLFLRMTPILGIRLNFEGAAVFCAPGRMRSWNGTRAELERKTI
jgi:hypothetical protein